MIKKIYAVIKKWFWIIVIAVISVFFTQKPRWVKQKEKQINERDNEIEESEKRANDLNDQYKEVKNKHDRQFEAIQNQKDDPIPFDDPVDAAHFIDDLLESIRSNKR